jgi:hypothetical protein
MANRLLRRANLAIRAKKRPATIELLAKLMHPDHQRRMLFVVGAARCGTTALQRALNASDDVFLLGEAYFFWENLNPDFRARYNSKHRGFGYAPSKQNDCPTLAPEDATWVEVLAALADCHHFVGEKITFGAYQGDRWPREFLEFHRRHFYEASYVLAFRNPRDAILSPRESWGIRNLVPWARSYIAAQRGLIRLRRSFPRTVPVFLETIGAATFESIEHCLGRPMPQLSSHLVQKPESDRDLQQIPAELFETVAGLDALYPALREAVSNSGAGKSDPSLDWIDARLAEMQSNLERRHIDTINARLTDWRRLLKRV